MNEQEIFERALELDSNGARHTFLEEACGEDPELRTRVEELLRSHETAGDFLESPAMEPTPTMLDSDTDATNEPASDPHGQTVVLNDQGEGTGIHFLTPTEKPGRIGGLGVYEVIEVIGRGGMGVVLKAFDPHLNRIVAIKTLAPDYANNPTARKRFAREAQAAAAVAHPHVVTIHAVEPTGNVPYLVMEFVQGQSLGQKLEKVGSLEVREILRIGAQIAQGLAAAHEQGLIHRDVKPGNVLLENGVERVKLTDFGLARATDDVAITKTGDIAGTPQYMSPEQAEGRIVDHRSDLFSLGSVLYAMCTGRPPFRGDTAIAVIRKVCDTEPRPIREVNPDIPTWLVDIIDHLLAKDPMHRIQTAEEVARILNEHLAELQNPSSGTNKPKFERRLPKPKQQSNWTKFALWLVLPSLLCAAGFVLWPMLFGPNTGDLRVIVEQPGISHTVYDLEGNPNPRGAAMGTVSQPHNVLHHRMEPGMYWVKRHAAEDPFKGVLWRKVEVKAGETTQVAFPSALPEKPKSSPRIDVRLHGWSEEHAFVEYCNRSQQTVFSVLAEAPIYNADSASKRLGFLKDWGRDGLKPGDCRTERFTVRKQIPKFADTINLTIQHVDFGGGNEWPRIGKPSPGQGRWESLFNGKDLAGWKIHPGDPDRWIVENGLLTTRSGTTARLFSERGDYENFHLWAEVKLTETANGGIYFRSEFGYGFAIERLSKGAKTHAPLGMEMELTTTAGPPTGGIRPGSVFRLGKTRHDRIDASSDEIEPDKWHTVEIIASGKSITTKVDGKVVTDFTTDGTFAGGGHLALAATKPRVWFRKIEILELDENGNPKSPPENLKLAAKLPGASSLIRRVAFAPAGDEVWATTGRGKLFRWSVPEGRSMPTFPGADALATVHVAPLRDGRRILVSEKDGGVALRDLMSGKVLREFPAHPGEPHALAVSPDDRWAMTAASDGPVRLVDVETGQPKIEFECPGFCEVVVFSPDGKSAAYGDGTKVQVINVETGTLTRTIPGEPKGGFVSGTSFSPDGTWISVTQNKGATRLYQVKDGKKLAGFELPTFGTVEFLPDGRHFVVGCMDKTLRVFAVPSGEEVFRTTCETHCTNRIALSPNGRYLASGGGGEIGSNPGADGDYALRLWRLPQSVWPIVEPIVLERKLPPHGGWVESVALTGDGRAVTAAIDRQVSVWNLADGLRVDSFRLPFAGPMGISPDGRSLVVASGDDGDEKTTIGFWEVDGWKERWRVEIDAKAPYRFVFTPDGHVLLTTNRLPGAVIFDQRNGDVLAEVAEGGGNTTGAAVSPDGKRLFLRTFGPPKDRTGRIIRLADGAKLLDVECPAEKWVLAAVWSPDSKFVITGHTDGSVAVYDAGTGNLVREWSADGARVQSLVLTPSGALVTGGAERIGVWDWTTGSLIAVVPTPNLEGMEIAISPDGRSLVSGGGRWWDGEAHDTKDYAPRIWRLPESVWPKDEIALQAALKGANKAIRAVAFSADGRFAFATSGEKRLYQWDVAKREVVRHIEMADHARSLAVHPDGEHVFTGHYKGAVTQWNLADGKPVRHFEGHTEAVESLALSNDGRRLLSAGYDGLVRWWDVETGNVLHEFEDEYVPAAALSRDGWLAFHSARNDSGGNDIRLWETDSGKTRHLIKRGGGKRGYYAAAFSPDGRHLVAGDAEGTIELWDVKSGKQVARAKVHQTAVHSLIFTRDGRHIISGSTDKTLQLLEAGDLHEVAVKRTPTFCVTHLALSPDGRTIASAGGWNYRVVNGEGENYVDGDFDVRLWQLPQSVWPKRSDDDAMRVIRKLEGHTGGVLAAKFSPDGTRIASVSGWEHINPDDTIRIWNAATGDLLHTMHREEGVTNVCFSPDGKTILAAEWNQTATLWDVATGQLIWKSPRLRRLQQGIAFAPEGSRFYTVDPDLKEWDLKTQKVVRTIPPPEKLSLRHCMTMGISSDGRYICCIYFSQIGQTCVLYDLEKGTSKVPWDDLDNGQNWLAMSHSGHRIAVSTGQENVWLYDIDTGERTDLNLDLGNASRITFTPDDQHLITSRLGSFGYVVDLKMQRIVHKFHRQLTPVMAVDASPDGRTFLLAGGKEPPDYAIRLWRLPQSVWPASPFPVGSMPYVLTSDEYVWAEPVKLNVNSPQNDGGPWISADGLTLLFSSDRPGGKGAYDIWQSTRKNVDAPWSEPVNLGSPVNTRSYDSKPSMSSDGRTLVFVSTRPGGQGGMDLWMATRASPDDKWGEPVNLGDVVNGPESESDPWLSDDGLRLIFIAKVGDGHRTVLSTRGSVDGVWSKPEPLTGTSPVLREYPPFDAGRLLSRVGEVEVDLFEWSPDEREWVRTNAIGPPVNVGQRSAWPRFHRSTNTLYWQSGEKPNLDLWTARRMKRQGAGESRWTSLFNGRDLTGWKYHPDQTGEWFVENGILKSKGPPSYLFSERGDFEHFHLRIEGRVFKGDSGVFVRSEFDVVETRPGVRQPVGVESQIMADDEGTRLGSILGAPRYKRIAPESKVARGEWFVMDVIATSTKYTVRVNGTEVVSSDDPKDEFRRGHVALQQFTDETSVEFRRIEIREFVPGSANTPDRADEPHIPATAEKASSLPNNTPTEKSEAMRKGEPQ